MQPFSYYHPTELNALFELMQQYPSAYKLLAGGTDLLVRLKSGRIAPKAVIDIKAIPEIQGSIERVGESYVIGALTLMSDLESDPTIQHSYPALAEAVHNVGSVQIRNRATLAGNLLLVIRTGRTERALAHTHLDNLTRVSTRVLGVVLNGTREQSIYRYYRYLPGYDSGNEEAEPKQLQPAV